MFIIWQGAIGGLSRSERTTRRSDRDDVNRRVLMAVVCAVTVFAATGWPVGMVLAAVSLAVLRPAPVLGQRLPVGDVFETYLRVLQVRGFATAGSLHIRPLSDWSMPQTSGAAAHPWANVPNAEIEASTDVLRTSVAPVRLTTSGNTTVPFGGNDGAIWQGRGLNLAVDGGGTAVWGRFSLTLRPMLTYAQNQSFRLAPVDRVGATEYSYP